MRRKRTKVVRVAKRMAGCMLAVAMTLTSIPVSSGNQYKGNIMCMRMMKH